MRSRSRRIETAQREAIKAVVELLLLEALLSLSLIILVVLLLLLFSVVLSRDGVVDGTMSMAVL